MSSNQDQELQEVRQAIAEMVKRYPMAVTNAEENLAAKTAIITIRKERKARTAWFNDYILAHSKKAYHEAKAAYDAQRQVLTDLLKPMADWEHSTDQNIRAFEQAERDRERREREREAQKYQKRLDNAEAKGKDLTTVKPPKLVGTAPKSVRTSAGVYTVKAEKELVIFDETCIPEQYWLRTINKGLIESELRRGGEVPGCVLRDKIGSAVR